MPYSQWTNTAQSPSELPYRSSQEIRQVADMLGIPKCGHDTLVSAVKSGYGHPLLASKQMAFSKYHSFEPNMLMSFRKDGIDYVDMVVPAPGVIANGQLIILECGNSTTYVAMWPRCGNLSLMTLGEELYGYTDRDQVPHGSVSEPSSLLLILIGTVLYFYRKSKTC